MGVLGEGSVDAGKLAPLKAATMPQFLRLEGIKGGIFSHKSFV